MVRIIGIGSKTIVQVGIYWKIGNKLKKAPTVTKDRIPVDAVEIRGKRSFFTLTDSKIPTFVVRLIIPPIVPREKIWKNIIPVIRKIANSSLRDLILEKTMYKTTK